MFFHDHPLTSRGALGALSLLFAASALGCRPAPTAGPDAAPRSSSPAVSASAPPEEPAPAVPPLSPGARTEDERNTIAVFRDAAPSTVYVTQTRVVVDQLAGLAQEVPAGSGSGFLWDTEGHVVTNFHVVQGARSLTVTLHDQQTFDATVVGAEPRKDIAVLKIGAPAAALKPIKTTAKMELDVGQKVIAIGNPFGLDHTLTTGVVSAVGRQVQGVGGVTIRDMIQTDAAINPGNSGGPLIDSSGHLIGMNTMIFSRSGAFAGIGFAVPASAILRIVPQIIKTGRAEQLGLGIQIDPNQRLERRLGLRGVLVIATQPGSNAEKAGLRGVTQTPRGIALGDLIVGIDDAKIDGYDSLYNTLDTHSAGDEVAVKVRRGDQIVTVKIPLVVLP